ncbi:MAG: BtpA protein [Limisphaera sp.]|nr:MAG: BtpA protein [Limisphaera sp.]
MAVVALQPLPGSPLHAGSHRAILERALADAHLYQRAGVDALLIENSYDLPYTQPPLPGPAIRLVTRIARELRSLFPGPIGIQLLEAANETALEIAAETDLDFLRVEGYVFAHVGGAGIIQGCAGRLLRLRRRLRAEHIRIFADLKKKHCAHALTADLDIVDELKQAEFFLADGVIVTGPRTGEAPALQELHRVRRHAHVPVWIGSGITPTNLPRYFKEADGFIVGSAFRTGGDFFGSTDPERLRAFLETWRRCRDASRHRA